MIIPEEDCIRPTKSEEGFDNGTCSIRVEAGRPTPERRRGLEKKSFLLSLQNVSNMNREINKKKSGTRLNFFRTKKYCEYEKKKINRKPGKIGPNSLDMIRIDKTLCL